MATNNALNVGLSGSTGTGNIVGSTSPTITTPTLNQPNIVGVTNGSSAPAGSVGEVISSTIALGSAVSATSNVVLNITTISLTAGQWEVCGSAAVTGTGGAVVTIIRGAVSLTSATAVLGNMAIDHAAASVGSQPTKTQGSDSMPVVSFGDAIINVSATTTVYLCGLVAFTTQPMSMYGKIVATRIR